MGDSIAEKIIVPLTKAFGGPRAEEHARAYYDDMGKHEFGAAAKEALLSNLETAKYWGEGVVHAAQAVGHAVSSVVHHDRPLDTPPSGNDARGRTK